MVACLLACGIDPEKSVLFLQSQVSVLLINSQNTSRPEAKYMKIF